MRKSARIAALVAGPIMVLGIGAATAAPAFASTGTGSNGSSANQTGKAGAAKYTDPVFGLVQCNETQHPQFDNVTCKFMAGQVQTPNAAGQVGWNSDWLGTSGLLPGHANTGTLTYTINADGTGYSGQATYPNG